MNGNGFGESTNNQEERQRLSFSEGNSSNWEYRYENLSKVVFPSSGSPELSPSTSVMDRLFMALKFIKEGSMDKNVLIQVWMPVNKDGKRVLTTSNQPFSAADCQSLKSYREISVKYQFPTEEEDGSRESVGFPGRVFMGKVPEWTPDVQYFERTEYPRLGHAQQYDVHGALGVPIFEQGSRNCLGVIEVLLTTQKASYRPELENVCNALKAVDLQTSDVSSNETHEVNDFSCESSSLGEIRDVFREACGTCNLPLAQAWVSCTVQGKGGCRHSEETLSRCVSTVDSASFIADPRTQGFNEACSEHHLLKGQGIVGRAFMTNQPCFCHDVSTLTKKEYPLSHHARMLELCAAVAIRLRSSKTETDFVLEFFLPVDCKDSREQMDLLSSLSLIIHKVCQGLRVITDEEFQGEAP